MAQANSKPDIRESIEIPVIGKRWFYTYANCPSEYIYNIEPRKEFLFNLMRKGVDLFNFNQRTFFQETSKYPFHKEYENIAIMKIDSYDDWWTKTIKKKVRQSVKKAEKNGVKVRTVEINEDFFRGVQRIYNETPFREGRRYSGYSLSIGHLREKFNDIGDSEILGAYHNGQLIGILWITFGNRTAKFRSFISFIKHRDKCPNNALIAQAVRRCCERKIIFLVYGNHYGHLPGLDMFRKRQGFRKVTLPRYYVPLSRAGQLAIELGIHKKIEYTLPTILQRVLLKLYNHISRMIPATIWWRFGGK